MKRLVLATIALVTLAHAGAASAGCLATVGLAPPPASVRAGDTWTARMTVLQHGRTPLPDAKSARPTLTIVNDGTGARQTFAARVTKDPAVFETAVVFPLGGSWRYEVFDGFTSMEGQAVPCAQTHTFGAVLIGRPAGGSGAGPGPAVAAAGESSFPVRPVAGGALAALLALAVSAALVRRRRGGEVAAG